MENLLNYCPLVVGVVLALGAGARAVLKDKFGTPGIALLVFGFLFAALPFAKNLQMSGLGVNVKIEALEKQVKVAENQAVVAANKTSKAATALKSSLDSSQALTDCMEEAWLKNGRGDAKQGQLVKESRQAISQAKAALNEVF